MQSGHIVVNLVFAAGFSSCKKFLEVNMATIDERLDCLTTGDSSIVLANAIHTYVNYNEIAKKAEEMGAVMKEAREHYEYIILRELEKLFQGKDEPVILFNILQLFD